jgi:hypothetical protein
MARRREQLLLLSFFSLAVTCTAGCSSDEGCSLNGVCTTSGTCACVPEWTGDDCGVLNLEPARVRPNAGYDEGPLTDHVSSWGGSIVADPQGGLFHMWVSRMGGHCGLGQWQSDSEIVHATSTDPVGPYTMVDKVLPYFAHGPSVRVLPHGKGYVMMHLGCGYSFTPWKNCTKHTREERQQLKQLNPPMCNQFNVSIMTAPTVNGPWSGAQPGTAGGKQVFLSTGPTRAAAESWYVPSGRQFSNPAPHFLANGSILCAYRADARSGGEHVSVALAEGGADATEYIDSRGSAAVANHTGEDPFLWQDERGHFHMIMHNMGGPVGSHAFSRDGVRWDRSATAPYTHTVTYEDSSVVKMGRRERPQLLLSGTGQPRYFSSGVELPGGQEVYTLVMAVKQKYF